LEPSKPSKQNSKITKMAYLDEKKNNQPVHCHIIKQNKQSTCTKEGGRRKKWQIMRQKKKH